MADSSSSGGVGIVGLLGVAFVVLKLTGYINWSWWWVTAPFWGGFALFVLIVGGVVVTAAVSASRKPSRRW